MIVFEEVSKEFVHNRKALQDISFQVKKGETLVLLGRSGSGKTTAMKMINRMIEPTTGTITIDGEDVANYDPIALRRMIGYAVQHVGLFNHMTIEENVSIVPKLLKWPQKKIDERVDELLLLMKLSPKMIRKRYPQQLSGGQKQRICVARALAADPPILLMDEAFAALDPITKEQVQNEFLELESDIKKTVVFVTHDLLEAVKLGDRIALMEGGKIVQIATPYDLIHHPQNSFVKQFLGPHQFQLVLMTKTIESLPLIEELRQVFDKACLSIKSSLLEALDLFKETQKEELPIYQGKTCLGLLRKSVLLDAITNVLQEKKELVLC